MRRIDLSITGAGPADLAAVLAARSKRLEIEVFEKRSDVGGRYHCVFPAPRGMTVTFVILGLIAIVLMGPSEFRL